MLIEKELQVQNKRLSWQGGAQRGKHIHTQTQTHRHTHTNTHTHAHFFRHLCFEIIHSWKIIFVPNAIEIILILSLQE
jgi:hypothetical protein